MLRRLVVLALCLVPLAASAQTAPALVSPPANPKVALETSAGPMVVEVYLDKAPVSARNFLRYVDAKRLDGVVFYRTVKPAENFGFVQFGIQNAAAKMYPPIKHEPTTETGIKHLDGTLSLPRLAPGSARGEFTIMVGDQPSFDADPSKPGDNLGYAAFGRVIEGRDVLLKIFDAPTSPTKTIMGSFKGEVPEAPVKIVTARRIAG
ncbi:peptidylprolyl isomerase [Sphingomonas sp. ABOLD]|uniref:peptidylprolyl isomerase n=1 Tax=Sphingomonas trueperi TaxID=53317 RepID=A0A7X6BCL2_9SPHN|nr:MULTISPECIES: peptidylprolyl isomerase [Sphingomonas]NJB96991.1 peptidyl-prolyl cis-trans isomerase A (cyclophilin A) [Sphingomonas trueperi]RSV42843.1 peptidylprolyl isomerase [Sphingomonas sp. ABOLE]RSV50829.1 peptidylprolyl isomerase [Sphingomonas sp. ABOLD]